MQLGCFRHVVQNKQLGSGTRSDGIWPPIIVAEFDEHRRAVELFDNGADVPPRQPVVRKVCQQRDNIQCPWRSIFVVVYCAHYTTQQVTKVGRSSPARTIHAVLTTACF